MRLASFPISAAFLGAASLFGARASSEDPSRVGKGDGGRLNNAHGFQDTDGTRTVVDFPPSIPKHDRSSSSSYTYEPSSSSDSDSDYVSSDSLSEPIPDVTRRLGSSVGTEGKEGEEEVLEEATEGNYKEDGGGSQVEFSLGYSVPTSAAERLSIVFPEGKSSVIRVFADDTRNTTRFDCVSVKYSVPEKLVTLGIARVASREPVMVLLTPEPAASLDADGAAVIGADYADYADAPALSHVVSAEVGPVKLENDVAGSGSGDTPETGLRRAGSAYVTACAEAGLTFGEVFVEFDTTGDGGLMPGPPPHEVDVAWVGEVAREAEQGKESARPSVTPPAAAGRYYAHRLHRRHHRRHSNGEKRAERAGSATLVAVSAASEANRVRHGEMAGDSQVTMTPAGQEEQRQKKQQRLGASNEGSGGTEGAMPDHDNKKKKVVPDRASVDVEIRLDFEPAIPLGESGSGSSTSTSTSSSSSSSSVFSYCVFVVRSGGARGLSAYDARIAATFYKGLRTYGEGVSDGDSAGTCLPVADTSPTIRIYSLDSAVVLTLAARRADYSYPGGPVGADGIHYELYAPVEVSTAEVELYILGSQFLMLVVKVLAVIILAVAVGGGAAWLCLRGIKRGGQQFTRLERNEGPLMMQPMYPIHGNGDLEIDRGLRAGDGSSGGSDLEELDVEHALSDGSDTDLDVAPFV